MTFDNVDDFRRLSHNLRSVTVTSVADHYICEPLLESSQWFLLGWADAIWMPQALLTL
jgi:hypothetical protein